MWFDHFIAQQGYLTRLSIMGGRRKEAARALSVLSYHSMQYSASNTSIMHAGAAMWDGDVIFFDVPQISGTGYGVRAPLENENFLHILGKLKQ
jgi:hypothetical protein